MPRDLYEKYNEAKRVVTWLNGSTTRFAYCDTESDVYRYQGAEYLFIGVDELTHFTLKQWQFLTSRNRCRIRGAKPCMAGATNPGNIGHAWVKALWVDHRLLPRHGSPRSVRSARGRHSFTRRLRTIRISRTTTNTKKRSGSFPKRCGARFSTASGTSSPGNTSIFFRWSGTRACRRSSVSSWTTRW